MTLLTAEEGNHAIDDAITIIAETITGTNPPHTNDPPIFAENRGVFVTLTKSGTLRGCIGYPYPTYPLSIALHHAACSAATKDPRFAPVQPEELADLDIEITILTNPVPLTCSAEARPNNIEPGKHGLIAEYLGHSGLLLPQVAVEWNWTAEEFLSQTCIKAALPPDTWKTDACTIKTFEGQIFTRTKPWQ